MRERAAVSNSRRMIVGFVALLAILALTAFFSAASVKAAAGEEGDEPIMGGYLAELNGELSIGDLAIMVDAYGKTRENEEVWESIKHMDLNGDDRIDIDDLVELAKRILQY